MADSRSVRFVSDCFVKPQHAVEDLTEPIHYPKPQNPDNTKDGLMESFLDKLKGSLSAALVHFYPLAGRLKMVRKYDSHFYTVCIDCVDSPGARLIYATLDLTVSDLLSPVYVPKVAQSLFDHDRALNHDGHTKSLLSIQVTELVDDGTSYWNFLNSWSEIFRAQEKGNYENAISRPPVLSRWFPEGCDIPINLPFRELSEFHLPYESPILKERLFHFSADTIGRLKIAVNNEIGKKKKADEISSFKALTALVSVSITRARRYPPGQVTSCWMAADNRARMRPALSPDYFGNSVFPVRATATAGDLLSGGLGAAAWLLHVAVAEHTAERISELHRRWLESPTIYNMRGNSDPGSVMMGSSPRFNKYGVEFGLGKAVALRSGYANKIDGKVSAYPRREGGGSVDLEISLSPENMAALEADAEFMATVDGGCWS